MADRVIVLGGGVAGLSAAHELSERGFAVTVFETREAAGGKARSFPLPGSGQDGRPPLPGEHGFRFFPGFYRHLPHRMSRIPYGAGAGSVADNLVAASDMQIARKDGQEPIVPVHLPRNLTDLHVAKAVGRLIRSDLIVIDDIGMLPVAPDAAEALFRVVDAAYEKRSIALTSNIHPAGFDELMPKALAAATVDRLLHHAHVLVTDGTDSYRLAQATAGKGVMPLAN